MPAQQCVRIGRYFQDWLVIGEGRSSHFQEDSVEK